MAHRIFYTFAGILVLIAALIVGRAARSPEHAAAPPDRVEPAAPALTGLAARAAAALAPPAAGEDDSAAADPLPNSLEGSEPDGAVSADGDGRLVISIELRRLFDYFLSATGEEPLTTIRARIIATLRKRLPKTAVDEAIDILDRYLAYREAARHLAPNGDIATAVGQLHDLRARMFSPDVTRAFFADDEAAVYAALARRDALLDPSLPADERARRLAEIDAREPAAVVAARAAATAPIEQMKREEWMRAAGASDRDIANQRSAALGAEAAARLAELDRTRAAWQARLDEFRTQRAALLADARLSSAERQRRIDDLLERSFSPPERLRVEALDRIAAQAGGP